MKVKTNKIKTKVFLVIFATVIALLLSEIILRLLIQERIEPTQCRKFDPVLDHSLVPNSICRFKTKEWDLEFKVNSQGLRDKEYSIQKPAGVYRIIMLGDSFVEGYGVNLEDNYGKVLEKMLNENSGKKIEVINAGISGWSPLSQYLYLLEYGIKYQPDLVILNFNSTDFFDDYEFYSRLTNEAKQILEQDQKQQLTQAKEAKKISQSKIFTPKPLYTESVNDPQNIPFVSDRIKFFLNKNFYVYHYLTRSIKLALGRATTIEVSPKSDRGKMEKDLFAITRTDNISEYKELFKRPQEDILRMKKIVEGNNSQLMVLLIPHGHMVGGNQWTIGRTPWGFEKGKIYSSQSLKEISRWAQETGIETFDLTPNLREASKSQKLYFDFDGHWNKNGNKVVAETLLAVLGLKILN